MTDTKIINLLTPTINKFPSQEPPSLDFNIHLAVKTIYFLGQELNSSTGQIILIIVTNHNNHYK